MEKLEFVCHKQECPLKLKRAPSKLAQPKVKSSLSLAKLLPVAPLSKTFQQMDDHY